MFATLLTTPSRGAAGRRPTRPRPTTLSIGIVLLATIACDRSATEPTVEGRRVSEIILQDAAGNVYFSHRDHWHGAPPLRVGEQVALSVYFVPDPMPPDEHEAPPREQWISLADLADHELRGVVEDVTAATWTGDRSGGRLAGLRDASTRISFVVRRSGTTVYEAPPLTFRVRP